MTEGISSSSVVRRLLMGLVLIGIDLRPVLRRGRDALLRPVRNEMAVERAMWEANSVAHHTEGENLRAHLARIETQLFEISSRQRESENRSAELGASLSRLETQLFEISSRQRESENRSAELGASLSRLETQLFEISSRLMAERRERRSRATILERLVTEPPGPRLPAVARAIEEMPSPIVSVILPTKDRAHIIADAIASVQSQYFTDWELIIVDNGSVDVTAAIIAPYLADQRIRYIDQPIAGVSAARNQGLRAARGRLIAYLDSDNVWYPGFLSAVVDKFAVDPAVDVVYGVLVTDDHGLDGTRLLWEPFDRNQLLAGNYIDMNVIVHRKSMVERYGGFDETLNRLVDWDLILRYTAHAPACALPALAARYRACDDIRITTTKPISPELLAVRRKWYPPAAALRRPRILYLLWQYPQPSEADIEVEIRCMLRWGVHVEVWRAVEPASPYPASVPVHDGSLADAARRVQPDVIHVHWIQFAAMHAHTLAQLGIPVTLRMHVFDTSPTDVRAFLDKLWIHKIYCFPHQLQNIGLDNSKLRVVPVAFDTTLFRPHPEKDRRLVVRAGAALPSKDIPFFFELAKRLPDYRFVLAVVTYAGMESYVASLRDIRRQMDSPCELLFDIPQKDIALLMEQAGIYVHTARLPETEYTIPIGMPISIAEAMATGALVLVRDIPELRDQVGDAGLIYRHVEHAVEIIESTANWPLSAWRKSWMTSVERAFSIYADELALRPIFEDWRSVIR